MNMNVNEIIDRILQLDPAVLLPGNSGEIQALTQNAATLLIIEAVFGVLLCLFGLKVVRFWAALFGLAAGFELGFYVSLMLGLEGYAVLIIGAVAGILLAAVAARLYRAGIFLIVFAAVSSFGLGLIDRQNWIFVTVCLVIGLVAAILSIWAAPIVTIIATSLYGACLAGFAAAELLAVDSNLIRIVICAAVCVVGILVQLMFESRRQNKKSLKKAAEIREQESTAKEVERARAMMYDMDGQSSGDETDEEK